MTEAKDREESSRFRLGGRTPDGDLVVFDGDKQIDIMNHHKIGEDGVPDLTLFANSLRHWRYPHHEEPLTQNIKEEILRQVSCLLRARAENVRVKVEW